MMDEEWWMMDDGWWMMNDGWWKMDDGWWIIDDDDGVNGMALSQFLTVSCQIFKKNSDSLSLFYHLGSTLKYATAGVAGAVLRSPL